MGISKVFCKIQGIFSRSLSTSKENASSMRGVTAIDSGTRASSNISMASSPHNISQSPFRGEGVLGASTSCSVPELSTTRDTGCDSEAASATMQLGGAHPEIGSPHMFGNNNFIQGGTFTLVNSTSSLKSERPAFKALQKQAAPAAFHNSIQHVDPPRCHPETRVEILQSIYNWIIQCDNREHWLLWLNGAAGAGKSAIMRTTIEHCIDEHIAISSFFFGRSDATRNTMTPLVATLAYQLIRTIPDTLDDILQTIEQDPLIFNQSIEHQFRELIIQPLVHLPKKLRCLFVVFIDGLDECLDRSHQSNLLRFLGNLCSNKNIPVIFTIASRREPQINAEFGMKKISKLLKIVPLDDSEASDDIRQYLNAKFAEIKQTHQFRHRLPQDWPSVSMVSEIVDKSSGQFIFASVVINYISSPRANPARQLEIIHDLRLRDPSSEHPFAHLDSLYQHIFSQVEYLPKVLDILAFQIITGFSSLNALEPVVGDPEALLADLSPVLWCKCDSNGHVKVNFLHASLPNFLQEQSRSQGYFLNLEEYRTKLLCIFLEQSIQNPLSPSYDWDVVAKQEYWRLQAIWKFLQRATVSDRLRCAIINFSSTFHHIKMDDMSRNTGSRVDILHLLKNLDFADQGQAYQHVLDMFAEGHAKFWTSHSEMVKVDVRDSWDLCTQICQLRPELRGDPSLEPHPLAE